MGYGMNTAAQLRGNTGTAGSPTGQFKEKRPHGYQKFSMQQFTPEQLGMLQQLFGQIGPESFMSKLAGGDQGIFDEMEAPALRQFSGLQGNIASRFSGMGLGGRNSSGFQNTMNSAASNFAQELQSQRQGLKRQALIDLFNMGNLLMNQRPFEQGYVQKPRTGGTAEMIGNLGGLVPGLVSSFTGGGSVGDALKGASSIFGGRSNAGSYDMAARTNPAFLGF